MIDIQTVFVRDVAELRGINYMSMIRVTLPVKPPSEFVNLDTSTFSTVTDVIVNGASANFFLEDPWNLLIALPIDMLRAGKSVATVSSIVLARTSKDAEGDDIVTNEPVGLGSGIDLKAKAGSKKVTVDAGILQLRGDKFSKTVAVYVNKRGVPFTVMSDQMILCSLPPKATSIDDVEVITSSKTLNRKSMFAYLFSNETKTVEGEFKLVQQFIKVLLTTPGSDVFDKKTGGNLQNWVGQNTPTSNPSILVAKTTLKVIQAGLMFSARQGLTQLPASERLSDVEVVSVDYDRSDPSVVNLTIKLNTFARRQAVLSMMIGTAQDAIESIVESQSAEGIGL